MSPETVLLDGLSIAGHEVGAHGEVPVGDLGEIVPAQFAQGFRKIIDHKAVVISE